MAAKFSDKALDRIYNALMAMDKNIGRVQAIAEGRPISLSSKELIDKKEG